MDTKDPLLTTQSGEYSKPWYGAAIYQQFQDGDMVPLWFECTDDMFRSSDTITIGEYISTVTDPMKKSVLEDLFAQWKEMKGDSRCP